MGGSMGLVWVAGGGAVGAWCRYRVTAWFAGRYGGAFPYGTLFVNVLGSCLMGLCMAFAAQAESPGTLATGPWRQVLAEGFLGAFTTFSAFATECAQAFATGKTGKGLRILALNLVLCISGVAAGYRILS